MAKKRKKNRSRTSKGGGSADWGQAVANSMDAELQVNAIPEGKMSDVVAEYAAPLIDMFTETENEVCEALALACLLWNLCALKENDEETFRRTENSLIQLLGDAPWYLFPAGALNLVSQMTKRWDQEYAWYRRLIVDKQIELRDDGPYLSIVSSPLGPKDE